MLGYILAIFFKIVFKFEKVEIGRLFFAGCFLIKIFSYLNTILRTHNFLCRNYTS